MLEMFYQTLSLKTMVQWETVCTLLNFLMIQPTYNGSLSCMLFRNTFYEEVASHKSVRNTKTNKWKNSSQKKQSKVISWNSQQLKKHKNKTKKQTKNPVSCTPISKDQTKSSSFLVIYFAVLLCNQARSANYIFSQLIIISCNLYLFINF